MPDDPINPLDQLPPAAIDAGLPAAEPLGDPLPEDQIGEPAPAPEPPAQAPPAVAMPATLNGSGGMDAATLGRLAAAARSQPQGPVLGDVRHLSAMQHDLEQASAEITSTRRAVQLLAVSLGAIAALLALYLFRGLRAAPAGAGAGAKGGPA